MTKGQSLKKSAHYTAGHNGEKLMAKIPKPDPFDDLNHKLVKQELRPYLGLSQVGHSCHRYLQYYHYWAYSEYIEARILRLFNVGHQAEHVMKADLRKIDIITFDDQLEIVGAGGHWRGHIDDKGYHTYKKDYMFLVEYKTHNDANFKKVKKGKIKRTMPMHYDQMQSYMDGIKADKGLYMALNKNTSHYHFEWVDKDPERVTELKRKQVEVIASDVLLPRIGNDSPSWFECKMCSANSVCFGKKLPEKNCRTCFYVDVLDEGRWACNLHAWELTPMMQSKACDDYTLGVMFK